MPEPVEGTRLLAVTPKPVSNAHNGIPARNSDNGRIEGGWDNPITPQYHPPPKYPPAAINVNTMKRNMSIAKGFMDISLLTANANQLKHLLLYGDSSNNVYYIIFTGLVLSLIFQIATGIILIMKERFDINLEDDQKSADLYNNITIALVFITLLLNVFISSFGVSVVKHNQIPADYDPIQSKGRQLGADFPPSQLTTKNPLFESVNNTIF